MSQSHLFTRRKTPLILKCLTFALGLAAAEVSAGTDPGPTESRELALTASWLEHILVAALLCLDLLIIRSLFAGFEGAIRKVRRALVILAASLLAILLWAAVSVLVSVGMVEAAMPELPDGSGWAALLSSLFATFAMLLIYLLFAAKRTTVRMSPSSKMVWHKGEWISIEAYLSQVMGVGVTHAMTGEEKEEALRKYREEVAKSGVPRPSRRK